jgi:ABC-type bacteriocin/lantibiotic exporter with double-glycine peptidase domain
MKIQYHPIPPNAIRIALPDTSQQKGYSCGASCLQSVCHYYGLGGEDEPEYVEKMKINPKVGSHPFQVRGLAEEYGLSWKEYQPMTMEQLKGELRGRKPVMLMIQAWGEEKGKDGWRKSYKGIWGEGHWVVAIGYDRDGIFFEDPSLQAVRGFLAYAELEERWHDVGPEKEHVEHYGLVLWKPRTKVSAYATRAERIA